MGKDWDRIFHLTRIGLGLFRLGVGGGVGLVGDTKHLPGQWRYDTFWILASILVEHEGPWEAERWGYRYGVICTSEESHKKTPWNVMFECTFPAGAGIIWEMLYGTRLGYFWLSPWGGEKGISQNIAGAGHKCTLKLIRPLRLEIIHQEMGSIIHFTRRQKGKLCVETKTSWGTKQQQQPCYEYLKNKGHAICQSFVRHNAIIIVGYLLY